MNKQIEEMAWDLCDIPKHPSIKSCEQCGNKYCLAMYYAKRACNNGYRKSTDVAKEIFAEIEEFMVDTELYKMPTKSILAEKFAEFKKKYESEGADDENNS